MLADAFVVASGEMENVFNKKEIPHDSELQKPEDLSVCLPESARSPSHVNVQVSVFLFLFKQDTFQSFFSRSLSLLANINDPINS